MPGSYLHGLFTGRIHTIPVSMAQCCRGDENAKHAKLNDPQAAAKIKIRSLSDTRSENSFPKARKPRK